MVVDNRGCIRGTPWTRAEIRTLKKVYPNGGVEAAIAALPGRSRGAIYACGRRFGMRGQRHVSPRWTPDEVATLKSLWGWEPVHHIARALDRLHKSVALKAAELGLKMEVPEGYEYVRHAAKRAGYDASSLRMILAWAGVRPKPFWGRTRIKYAGGKGRRHVVDSMEVDDAVAAWLKTETLNETRKRTGIGVARIRRIAADQGVPVNRVPMLGRKKIRETLASRRGCAHHRVNIEQIDAAIADWRATLGDYETTESACRRHGVSINCMRLWLAKHGVTLSRKERTRVEVFDRVVAIEKGRPGCQAVNPRQPWTQEEIDRLGNTYERGVAAAVAALPGRTERAIKAMAFSLGMVLRKQRRWTDAELARLRESYPLGIKAACAAFPDRTPESVRKKSLLLGLHRTQPSAATEDAA